MSTNGLRTETGRTVYSGAAGDVCQRHVWLGAKGWRHEINATWITTDHEGPVQRTDTLWLLTELDAATLARAAADELRAGRRLADGLSGLARRLGLTLPTH